MTIEEIKTRLQQVLSPKRYAHSIGVMETSKALAAKYGADVQQAVLAGLLHDCARGYSGEELLQKCRELGIEIHPVSRAQPELLHGAVGARLAETIYGVQDGAVRDAICFHTLARVDMSLLEKIVFIADYIELGRVFPGVHEIRKTAFEDLDKAVVMAIEGTLRHVMAQGGLIHPQAVDARNYILLRGRAENWNQKG